MDFSEIDFSKINLRKPLGFPHKNYVYPYYMNSQAEISAWTHKQIQLNIIETIVAHIAKERIEKASEQIYEEVFAEILGHIVNEYNAKL